MQTISAQSPRSLHRAVAVVLFAALLVSILAFSIVRSVGTAAPLAHHSGVGSAVDVASGPASVCHIFRPC